MSEFLAEAKVLILPDTKVFAATLKAQVEAAVAGVGPVVIPVAAAPVGAGVGKALAAETAAATTALTAEAGALHTVTLAAQETTAAGAALTRATRLQADAETLLATASEAGALSTTELAAARAVLAQTSRGVATAERAVAAAVISQDVALQAATAGTLELASAQEASAAAAVKDAIAQQRSAVAAAESATAHSQAARGAAAETLALTGLRGATLAASAPFLLGATAAIVFAKAIKEASDQTEELNKVAEVFGRSASEIEAFAKTTATSLGISETEALQATGIFGNLFRAIKISEPVAAAMSVQLVKLAADLASFNNASPERTLEALRAGLVGQARPLRVFGAFLTAARVSQEALLETGKKSITTITEAEKVQARYNLILQDTILAQGDVQRTQERLANQSRILKAQLANVSGEIGRVLIPTVLLAVQDVNLLIQAFQKLGGIRVNIPGTESGGSLDSLKDKITGIFGQGLSRELALNVLFPGLGFNIRNLELLNDALKHVVGSEDDASKATNHLNDALDAGARSARLAAFAIVSAQQAVTDLGSALKGLEIQALAIETGVAPGGRQAEENNLRKQIALDKKAVAESKSGTKARKEALIALKQDQDDLAVLEDQDAADAEARANKLRTAASEQEAAANKSAQAQAEATQAFIDSFSGRNQRLQNKLSSANLFGDAQAQLKINKAIVAADTAEIKAIQERIRHLHLHGDALKLALATIKTLNQEIFNTRNAILQLQAERKQALVDARQSHLEAQLAIAETTASTKDDAAAEKALIRFDQVQIRRILAIKRRRRLTLEEAAQLDAYRVDLAQRNQALNELANTAKESGKNFKNLAFEFLQTQQGFAANLLGNLIPGFATAGLVGNVSPSTPTADAAAIGANVQTSAQINRSQELGVRPVQVDRTNQLLQQILAALQGRHTTPPEAARNRRTGSAAFDTL